MSKLEPVGARLIATPTKPETRTSSGLYLPDTAVETPSLAEVIAVGPDVKQIAIGDKVVYKEYSTTEVKLDDVDYVIINEEDVLASVKE